MSKLQEQRKDSGPWLACSRGGLVRTGYESRAMDGNPSRHEHNRSSVDGFEGPFAGSIERGHYEVDLAYCLASRSISSP